jgi:hypothetical protein
MSQKQLSEFAKDAGLKTEWQAFKSDGLYSDLAVILEICKRIEALEEKFSQ